MMDYACQRPAWWSCSGARYPCTAAAVRSICSNLWYGKTKYCPCLVLPSRVRDVCSPWAGAKPCWSNARRTPQTNKHNRTVSVQSFNAGHRAQTVELWTFKGHSQVETSRDSGIWDPHFEHLCFGNWLFAEPAKNLKIRRLLDPSWPLFLGVSLPQT